VFLSHFRPTTGQIYSYRRSDGFQTSVSKDVEIKAEEPRGFDVTLQVGTVSETSDCNCECGSIAHRNASTGTTITTEEIAGSRSLAATLMNFCA